MITGLCGCGEVELTTGGTEEHRGSQNPHPVSAKTAETRVGQPENIRSLDCRERFWESFSFARDDSRDS